MPIIMVTAKDDEVDRVLGLELGADDYVVKPFSLRELLARIRAQLRRMEMNGAHPASTNDAEPDGRPDPPLHVGELELHPDSRAVFLRGSAVHLLPREFDLLHHLMRNQGIVLSRSRLLEKVWGVDYFGDERTVDVHIRRLRAKIEPDSDHPRFIHTIYGVGYTFDPRRSNDARAL
jgi:DNA-binding response OmpR family regulator